ncbi:hypothetical protein MRS44_000255 [Fusarium solani]|uniref:uncharacterized protein n=1 Tax=Fusarium solani TaxID=169388 RepID=UPI0032C41845|nr:hypothetical protein MRS44_000255 [Fusarium solani]
MRNTLPLQAPAPAPALALPRSCSSRSYLGQYTLAYSVLYCHTANPILAPRSRPLTPHPFSGSQHPKPHPPARISAHTVPRPLDLDKGRLANGIMESRPSTTALRYQAPSHALKLGRTETGLSGCSTAKAPYLSARPRCLR